MTHYHRLWRFAGAAALATITPATSAQLLCTMPNGIIIKRNIGDCPADATLVRKQTGEVVREAPPKQSPQAPPKQAQQAAPAQRTAYDVAQLACQAMRTSGATECTIDSSVFTTSYVNATLATTPRNATYTCKDLARAMRKGSQEFASRAWEVRIYSPFSGTRPIAACQV